MSVRTAIDPAAEKPVRLSREGADPLRGILWMFVSGLCFIAVNGIVRHLGTTLPAAEAAFLRFAFGLVFLGPMLVSALRAGFPAQVWRLFGLRTLIHGTAVICWFFAMARLPLAEVTSINFLNPICVTIGAALLFRERLALRRILAIAVAFAGAMVILRPGLRELAPAHFAMIAAAVGFGGSYLAAKRLSELVSPALVVAMLTLTLTLFLLPLALAVWVPPGLDELFWMAATAAIATAAHYCMTRAFVAAPLTVTQPVTFLQLVWATLMGVVLFGDPVDPWVLVGGLMIIAAISYMTWREAVLKRRSARVAVTPPVNAAKG